MVHAEADDVAHIGEALASVRAAIEVVASGVARQVVVRASDSEQILPAARALARTTGVAIEPIWRTDGAGCDIVVRPLPAGG
jgi:hypothetical protein